MLGHGMDVLSARVRGEARFMLSMKRPVKQAAPLVVFKVDALESAVTLAPYDHWRITAGYRHLCLESGPRLGTPFV